MATPRGDKRTRIVDTATRLILSQGVHATSISDIIAESGASAGSIYHRCAGKNHIVLAVARAKVQEPLRERLAVQHEGGLSPSELFRMIAETLLAGTVEPALIVQLWAGSSGEPELKVLLREQMDDMRVRAVAAVERWLAARGASETAEQAASLATLAIGQAMGLLVQDTLAPDFDGDAYIESASTMLDGAARQ